MISLFISCPKNMEYLLEDELKSLGLAITRVSPRGVYGDATLKILYKICLWSRLANRVHVILFEADAPDLPSFKNACRDYHWDSVFSVDKTFSIEFHGKAPFINNTMFGGQLIKDGVVDFFNEKMGKRPNVDKQQPQIRLQGYLKKGRLTVSLDVVGYSLHQRGYRLTHGGAPLKENIAAALLIRAGWPAMIDDEAPFIDPCCGSATLLIEAALMACQQAPGLFRFDQALPNWCGHDEDLWQQQRLLAEEKMVELRCPIVGFDVDPRAIEVAEQNIQRAGFANKIIVKQQSIVHFKMNSSKAGLLVCNPPYGERLKDPLSLLPVYQALGQALFDHCQQFKAAVFTSNTMLAQAVGLKVTKRYQFYNGALPTTLYCYDIGDDNQLKLNTKENRSGDALALFNRLQKNQKHLAKWLKRTGHSCYRLYNADLPNYAFAIDVYADWVHVQEYKPPKEIPEKKAQKRVIELMDILPEVLGINPKHIVLKQRQRQRGRNQYSAVDQRKRLITVTEGSAKFKVNLHDYLDTGLFLDHRVLRQQLAQNGKGKRFLNCFCYTAAFSVHAALAGALTYNVDMSNTYLRWAEDNFKLNKIDFKRHQFIQADCLKWLQGCQSRFDIILLDPPSFSNSKRMESTFDVQRDHVSLIENAMALLVSGGELYFSNNLSSFKLSEKVSERYSVDDITFKTLDEDFKKYKSAHRCYRIASR